jgi:Spy/CpxP family protein refolding chaperone
MKSLLKLTLVTLGLAAAAIPSVNAADAKSIRERHQMRPALVKHREILKKPAARKLDLNDSQRTQLRADREKTREAVKALRNDTTLSRTEKRDKLRELLQSSRADFRDTLTPEQKAKIDQLKANREAKRKARR